MFLLRLLFRSRRRLGFWRTFILFGVLAWALFFIGKAVASPPAAGACLGPNAVGGPAPLLASTFQPGSGQFPLIVSGNLDSSGATTITFRFRGLVRLTARAGTLYDAVGVAGSSLDISHITKCGLFPAHGRVTRDWQGRRLTVSAFCAGGCSFKILARASLSWNALGCGRIGFDASHVPNHGTYRYGDSQRSTFSTAANFVIPFGDARMTRNSPCAFAGRAKPVSNLSMSFDN